MKIFVGANPKCLTMFDNKALYLKCILVLGIFGVFLCFDNFKLCLIKSFILKLLLGLEEAQKVSRGWGRGSDHPPPIWLRP